MYVYQLSFPDEKYPFVQFSGYDPRTEAIITWETIEPEESVVWYGVIEQWLNYKKKDSAREYIHRVVLTGLNPDTTYYYRVGTEKPDSNIRSPVFSFKTAPNNDKTPFEFLLYSDSQQFFGIGWHERICNAIAGYENISFVADVGDLCQEWDYKPDWNQFFKESTVYMRKFPFVPCLGNHDGYYPEDDPENNKHHYKKYFGATVSDDGFYYSFSWSNTLFIVGEISKTGDRDPTIDRNRKHDIWLKETLSRGQDKDFRILMFHRQLFSAEGDDEQLIARIVPIAEKYNVDLVLYGHHHHYERFLYNDRTYICLGGGGGQQFGSDFFRTSENYTRSFSMGPSYTKVSVDSRELKIVTYSAENDVIDSCFIKSNSY